MKKVQKKVIAFEAMAAALAQDFIAAVYTSVGNQVVADQREGEWLQDVVEQSLDHQGMADEQMRLSSTRIECNVGLDVSASMFERWVGRPNVASAFIVRLLHKAFRIVEAELPADVFKFNIWLFAIGSGGRECACLTSPEFGNYTVTSIYNCDNNAVDGVLEGIGRSEPYYSGSGTRLLPWMAGVLKWEEAHGDPTAHKLDIVITDGLIHDAELVNKSQNMRPGKLSAMLLVIGGDVNRNLLGFTSYNINLFNLHDVIVAELMSFVQRIY